MLSVLSVSLIGIMYKVNSRNVRRQLLRGSLIGLLLTPIILTCFVAGSFFFGYRCVTAHGSSMEPALRDGDMIWAKYLDVADVKVGDIVILSSPDERSITHRVIKVQPLPQKGYLLETKGDANWLAEAWEISADGAVPVLVTRLRFAGYVLDFLGSVFGRALLIGVAAATLTAIWVRRLRMAHGGG